MSNPFKNYTTAAVAQQNWERKRQGQSLKPKEKAKKRLEAELYSLQHEYPEADYDELYNRLYQWAWVEELDDVFEDLDLTVDEVVSANIDL